MIVSEKSKHQVIITKKLKDTQLLRTLCFLPIHFKKMFISGLKNIHAKHFIPNKIILKGEDFDLNFIHNPNWIN